MTTKFKNISEIVNHHVAVSSAGKIDQLLNASKIYESEKRANTHMLVENIKKEMIKESFTLYNNVPQLVPYLIPLTVKAFIELVTADIVGVQAQTLPTGYVQGVRAIMSGSANDTAYRVEGKRADSKTDSAVIKLTTSVAPASDATPIVKGTVLTINGSALKVIHVEEVDRGRVSTDTDAQALEKVGKVLQALVKYTDDSDSDGTIDNWEENALTSGMTVSHIDTVLDTDWTVTKSQPNHNNLSDFVFTEYDGAEGNNVTEYEGVDNSDKIMSMKLDLISSEYKVEIKKLITDISFESMHSAEASGTINLMETMISLAVRQITASIDRRILKKIKRSAIQNSVKNIDLGSFIGNTIADRAVQFFGQVEEVARDMFVLNRIGEPNKMIVGNKALTLLSYHPAWNPAPKGTSTGVSKKGEILGFDVFWDSLESENALYLAYKGLKETEAGIIYAPFVAISMRSSLNDKSLDTRHLFYTMFAIVDNIYGTKLFYKKVTFEGAGL